jgi:hypothetical protein
MITTENRTTENQKILKNEIMLNDAQDIPMNAKNVLNIENEDSK